MSKKVSCSYDILGNLIIAKFPEGVKLRDKKKIAEDLIKEKNEVRTVVEKTGKFKGRLRKMETQHLAGVKSKEVLYKENGCLFRFNIDDTYFSPRLSNERRELSEKIKKGDNVLVMFAGVGPLPIVVAKRFLEKHVSKKDRLAGKILLKVYSVELNQKASKYAEQNVKLNKLMDVVEVVQGDVVKVVPDFVKKKIRFDKILMPRPQLKDSFLKEAFAVSRKGTEIYYYDFCLEENVDLILNMIKDEAKKVGKKIKILKSKKAGGNLAPGKIRLRVDFKVV